MCCEVELNGPGLRSVVGADCRVQRSVIGRRANLPFSSHSFGICETAAALCRSLLSGERCGLWDYRGARGAKVGGLVPERGSGERRSSLLVAYS